MSEAHENLTGQQRRVVRTWVRRDDAEGGWWPWGGLYLILLAALFAYALAYFAPHVIEAQTRDAVRARLAAATVESLAVDASGQRVHVTGTYAAGEREEGLVALAETARCRTLLFGELICPTLVTAALTEAAPVTPPRRIRDHPFRLAWSGTKLRLSGEIEDSGAQQAAFTFARRVFPDAEVVDAFDATGDRARADYGRALRRGLDVLRLLEDGAAEWNGERLTVSGNVRAATATAAELAFYRAEDAPPLGALVLEAIEEVDKCDAEFSAVLAQSTIYFATGKAQITSRSTGVLQRLAEVAARCPGDLVVEGHADIVGEPDYNKRLSLRRARAVVLALSDMGINPARLHPRGFGIERPAADNTTEQGRAQNRRIEVRIQRTEL